VPPFYPAPPIRQGAAEVTLLTSARTLPPEVSAYDRWRTGITHRSTQTVAVDARSLCATADWTTRETDPEQPEFAPFDIGVIHGCEGLVDERAYTREAQAALEDKTAWQIGRELWTGDITGNPSLQSTGVDVASGSTAVTDLVVSILCTAIEDTISGGQAFIHLPSLLLGPLMLAQTVTRVGNRLLTANGHVVIPGPGYPSTGTTGPAESEELSPGEVWVFATGPVEVGLGNVETRPLGPGTANRQNLFEVYATRPAIYRFDTGAVFAMKATLSNGG
jgi:hypothetical protein